MKNLLIKEKPYNKLIPEGISLPSSTLISGEGGSGKPLVGLKFVSSWLEKGGGVVFVLTSMDKRFFKKSLDKLYSTDLTQYSSKTSFIQLAPTLKDKERIKKEGVIKTNLLIPENWERELSNSFKNINCKREDILIFGTALNLFLFSPTYADAMEKSFIEIVKNASQESYLFTVSSSALYDRIKKIEDAADNLLYSYMQNWNIALEVKKLKNQKAKRDRKNLELGKNHLQEIKKSAIKGRNRLIPEIRKN